MPNRKQFEEIRYEWLAKKKRWNLSGHVALWEIKKGKNFCPLFLSCETVLCSLLKIQLYGIKSEEPSLLLRSELLIKTGVLSISDLVVKEMHNCV